MRDKYIVMDSSFPDDTKLVGKMLLTGYKMIQIVPRFFADGNCAGYTYWFEDAWEYNKKKYINDCCPR